MNTQKATIGATYKDERVGEWRDSAEHYKSLVVIMDDGPREVIKSVVKWPRDGAGRVRLIAWFFGNEELMHGRSVRHGTGTAGGYGYHKASAAFSQALKAAGITLDSDISGVGTDAIEDAMLATAEAMLGKKFSLRGDNKNAIIIG